MQIGGLLTTSMEVNYAHWNMRMEANMPTVQTQAVKKSGPRTRQPAKRSTNLSLNADVLDAAKALQIDISHVFDTHLRDVVRREQESRWLNEHADFVAAYNASIDAEGLPLDEWRTF
jgi:antitoxin CcdA